MIFKIHYFVFNAGLSGVLVLLTVFLRKYSDASSTEVGTLLMVLPFIAVFTKPFFCALADRHRKYKLYFILSLVFTLIGFGPYTLVPFYPEFVAAHGRASWYILVVFTVIGYIAYGVTWSLGDAYAANVSHKTGESFGLIRLWGTVGWGVAGAVVGLTSPYLNLPEMVLGFLIFVFVFIFEIALLTFWPNNSDFEMGDAVPDHGLSSAKIDSSQSLSSLKINPNLMIATMEEKPPRKETLEQQQQQQQQPQPQHHTVDRNQDDILVALSQMKSGQLIIQRTQSNSLAITTKVKLDVDHKVGDELDRSISDLVARTSDIEKSVTASERERQRISALQMTIFKMVAFKHKSLFKYLLIFVALGTVYNIHWSYFFLHLERLAAEGQGGDFSTLVGACLVAQAVGETFCFVIAPWVVKKLGRDGSISLNALAYAIRYFGNGIGIPMVSPYVAILTESLQGINYGIFYYLITDTALYYALLVDEIIPQLKEQKLIDEKSDLNLVRTSLRATMQGIFSGAFDGLGFGLGSLIAGLILEDHIYEELWCYAGAAAFVIFILHALYEITNQLIRKHCCSINSKRKSSEGNISDLIYSSEHIDCYKTNKSSCV